jgi:hypothetical protein
MRKPTLRDVANRLRLLFGDEDEKYVAIRAGLRFIYIWYARGEFKPTESHSTRYTKAQCLALLELVEN